MTGKGNVPLYGYAYFRNRESAKEKRGARQFALLIVATSPYFDRFRPFLTVAAEKYLDSDEDKEVIHELHDALVKSYRRTRKLALTRRSSFSTMSGSHEGDHLSAIGDESEGQNEDIEKDEDALFQEVGEEEEEDEEDFEDDDQDDATDGNSSIVENGVQRSSIYYGKLHRVKSEKALDKGLLLSSSCTYTMHIWGKMFVMQPLSKMAKNEFGGISLRQLVLTFRQQTMVLWAAVAGLSRLLICGPDSSGEEVGATVLAMPLLMGNLGSLVIPTLVPYVTLANVDPITKHSTYVCGTTNGLFATKEQWYDIVADPSTGKVSVSGQANFDKFMFKVQGPDLAFINRIIDGIENGKRDEKWVRYEFETFTQDFLDLVRELEAERQSLRAKENYKEIKPIPVPSVQIPELKPEMITSKSARLLGIAISPTSGKINNPSPPKVLPQLKPATTVFIGSSTYQQDTENRNRMLSVQRWRRGGKKQPTSVVLKKVKNPRSASEKVAITFAGTPLWLRYRWMQLNPESYVSKTRKQSQQQQHPRKEQACIQLAPSADIPEGDDYTEERDDQYRTKESRGSGKSFENTTTSSNPSIEGEESDVEPPYIRTQDSRPISAAIRDEKWRQAMTEDGKVYLWHVDTKETKWPEPDDLKSMVRHASAVHNRAEETDEEREDPVKRKSRLKSATTAPATLPSRGSAPPSSPKIGIEDYRGIQTGVQEEGEQKFEGATKWVMLSGRWQRVTVLMQEDLVLKTMRKSDWVEATTEDGKVYWHNLKNGQSQWERPSLTTKVA